MTETVLKNLENLGYCIEYNKEKTFAYLKPKRSAGIRFDFGATINKNTFTVRTISLAHFMEQESFEQLEGELTSFSMLVHEVFREVRNELN